MGCSRFRFRVRVRVRVSLIQIPTLTTQLRLQMIPLFYATVNQGTKLKRNSLIVIIIFSFLKTTKILFHDSFTWAFKCKISSYFDYHTNFL